MVMRNPGPRMCVTAPEMRTIPRLSSMRQIAARSAAALLAAALLAPIFGAGAVLADDLRDMFAGDTGLADNPETPGPDLYAPRPWGADIPDMPSLVVLDAPGDAARSETPRIAGTIILTARDLAPRTARAREIAARGPPPLSF